MISGSHVKIVFFQQVQVNFSFPVGIHWLRNSLTTVIFFLTPYCESYQSYTFFFYFFHRAARHSFHKKTQITATTHSLLPRKARTHVSETSKIIHWSVPAIAIPSRKTVTMPHRLSTRMIIRIRGGNVRKRFVGPLDQQEFEKLRKEWRRLQVRQRLIFRRINKIKKMEKSKKKKLL